MRISDWSSDVCSSDLAQAVSGDIGKAARDDRGLPEPCEFIEQDQDWDIAGSVGQIARVEIHQLLQEEAVNRRDPVDIVGRDTEIDRHVPRPDFAQVEIACRGRGIDHGVEPEIARSEEHTSELQSLMSISYAVFCLQKKK